MITPSPTERIAAIRANAITHSYVDEDDRMAIRPIDLEWLLSGVTNLYAQPLGRYATTPDARLTFSQWVRLALLAFGSRIRRSRVTPALRERSVRYAIDAGAREGSVEWRAKEIVNYISGMDQ